MNQVLNDFIDKASFGNLETHGPVSVLPIHTPAQSILEYTSLEPVLATEEMEIIDLLDTIEIFRKIMSICIERGSFFDETELENLQKRYDE